MADDNFVLLILTQLMWTVPTILVCTIGIAMVRARQLAKKVQTLASAGLGLLILAAIGSMVYSVLLRSGAIEYADPAFRFIQMAYGGITQILHVVALVLLILAVCNKEQTEVQRKTSVQNPYAE